MPTKPSELKRRRKEDPAFRERQNGYARKHRATVAADPKLVTRLREYKRAWAEAHRATPRGRQLQREARLRHRYGLTPEALDALWFSQGGCCAACESEDVLVVDHDHASGRVRGLLCTGCNVSLGLMQDDPDRIEALAKYIRAQA